MVVEIRLHHLSGMSLVNTVFGVANLLIHGEVIDIVGVGSSHILTLFKTLGFDVTYTKDELTKKVTKIKFSEIDFCEA